MSAAVDIVVVRERLDPLELRRLLDRFFEDMVKFVVDVEQGIAAVGGELHADAEARLLAEGSRQEDLSAGSARMTQHSDLTLERWQAFPEPQRILMIGNEMQRARSHFDPLERESLRRCYERVLRLTDLTVSASRRDGLRRELLRWRDLVAELFLAPNMDREVHDEVFRVLLLTSPESAKQIPLLGL